jgi:predicted GIY-YIG superfamily endonuclease
LGTQTQSYGWVYKTAPLFIYHSPLSFAVLQPVIPEKQGLSMWKYTKLNSVRYTLVYYEYHEDIDSAIRREKQLKKWKREWKLQLIEEQNPEWNDLYGEIR